MTTVLHEPVEVLVRCAKNVLYPLAFTYGGREYYIQEVTLRSHKFDGRESVHYFSVTDSANYFKLAFHTGSMTWFLEEVYTGT